MNDSGPLAFGQTSRLATSIAALICLTSSWDVFLTVQAGGTFRICQLAVVPLLGLAILTSIRNGIVPTLGLAPLLVWLLFQICFIPSTEFWPRSVGYCLWLALNVALLFSFTQIFSSSRYRLKALLRWYIRSFLIVAAFGIVQFVLPLLGLGNPLVQQWWIDGVLPRVNGFSYEPSYFATYMLIGFVFINVIRKTGSDVFSGRILLAACVLCAIAIVISSSRMGLAFLSCELLLPAIKNLANFLRSLTNGRIARSAVRGAIVSSITLTVFSSLAFVGFSILQQNPAVLLLFLNGTGISDTAAHSIVQRENAFGDTVAVFAAHPFVGRSLGGVASAIAELHGETITSFEESKQFEGMSTFAEVLAASGITGLFPFIWFGVTIVRRPLRIIPKTDPFIAGVLRACLRSLLYAVAILQFNQNILRPYLWVHLSILSAAYATARMQAGRASDSPQPNTPAPGM